MDALDTIVYFVFMAGYFILTFRLGMAWEKTKSKNASK